MNYTIMALLGAKDIGLRSTLSRASGDVQRSTKQMEAATGRTSKVALGLKAALAGVAVVAAAFLISGVSQAIKFEAAMRNVNSISRLSEQSLTGLSNQVLELSTRVPQSAQTLAQGLYDIASSGFQGAAGMEVLSVSAKAASAGLTQTDVASKAIVASLNAYGLTARDAADVSDILFQTVNVGVVSFEELASELGDVVGGAAAAGVSLDELGAAVAAMTLSGLSAAESTTSLNRLIQSLIDPSDALGNAFHNLGFESGKAALDALGLHGTMEMLREATGGNIETLLQLFPEIRAARGAFALMAADGRNYATTFGAIANEQSRAGATQRAFNEQMKALDNQWKLFVNNVNAAGIRLGTAFIPVLKSGLALLRDFGRGLGHTMMAIATAATPAFQAITRLGSNLVRLFGEIVDALTPIGRGLAVMAGGGVLAAVQGLANALGNLAGALADHPALIQTVAVALGGLLLVNLLSSAAAAAKLAVQARALLAMQTLGPIISNLVTRLAALRIGLQGLFAGNVVQQTLGLGTAFAGLGAAVAGIGVTAGFGALILSAGAAANVFSSTHAEAKKLRAEIERDIDFTSLESINAGLMENQRQLRAAQGDWESYGGRLRASFFYAAQALGPFADNVDEAVDSIDQLREQQQELITITDNLWSATNQLTGQFGITQKQAEEFLASIDFDPSADLYGEAGEPLIAIIEAFEKVRNAAAGATPQNEALADSFETVSDITSSATDRIEAFESALDSLFGVAISAREAEAQLAGAVQELGQSVAENGLTFDVWTEAGRANEEALRGNISAMVDLANATADETGSVQSGVDQLTLYREQLLGNLTAMGMSRQAAEDLVATYGLTPENLATLVDLQGADTASAALTDIQGMMEAIGAARAEGTVSLNSADFDNDAAAIGQWLVQIGMAAPEATVLMDDQPFRATAAQVQAWAQMWDDSSPEAQALLNIIDPQNRFATLSAAAAGWAAQHPTATAGVHDNASGILSVIDRALDNINGRISYADVVVRYSAQGNAAAAIAAGKRQRWGGIVAAQTGLTWEAGIVRDPTVLFGERGTGGEAYVPRLGNYQRSMSILAKAASWYGAEVVPRQQAIRPVMGVSGGQSYTFSPNIAVQVRADAGVDSGRLAKMIRREVGEEIDMQLDKVRRELRAR